MLKTFLATRRSLLEHQDAVFVFGNESADCDSIISALAIAYLISKDTVRPYIPVVNNVKDVVKLRAEVAVALAKSSLDFEDLIYLDDFLRTRPDFFDAFLVDHNLPSPKWSRLGLQFKVVGIIDHRIDSGLFVECQPRIIQTCGSCTSLIVNTFSKSEELSRIAQMLLTVMTVDTVNWTWRVTDFDVQMAMLLKGWHFASDMVKAKESLHLECAGILAEIEASTVPEESVDLNLLLQKDFKMYEKNGTFYGISVIRIDVTKTISELKSAMKVLRSEEKMDFIMSIAVVRFPGQYTFSQYFVMQHPISSDYKRIIGHLTEPLELEMISETNDFGLFHLKNLDISRKPLQPLIEAII